MEKTSQVARSDTYGPEVFREMTTGKVVVMGRKTLESFPNSRPLKNRTNIVLTHNPSYEVEGAVVVHSLDELHKELEKYNSEDIYIIGGQKFMSSSWMNAM